MLKTLKLFKRRKQRVRASIKKLNHDGRLRLSVFRSNNHIYAQLIDDKNSRTVLSVSSLDKEFKDIVKNGANITAAEIVGKTVAQKAIAANISQVVFDKGGYIFHGRVKALAEAARATGLDF